MFPNAVAIETSANCAGGSASGMALHSCPKVCELGLCIPPSASHGPEPSLGGDVSWLKRCPVRDEALSQQQLIFSAAGGLVSGPEE